MDVAKRKRTVFQELTHNESKTDNSLVILFLRVKMNIFVPRDLSCVLKQGWKHYKGFTADTFPWMSPVR